MLIQIQKTQLFFSLGKNIEESVAGVRHTIPKETDQPSNKTTFDIANDAVEAQGK